jgi:hypothetical protein
MASHGRGRHYGTRQTLQGTCLRGFSVRSSPSTVGAEGTLQHVKQLPARHQGRAPCRHPAQAVVLVVERSGRHRAPQRDPTGDHAHGTGRCQGCPAHGGHHRNPIAGCWRVLKDTIGAGRGLAHLQLCSRRTRQGLRTPQARSI